MKEKEDWFASWFDSPYYHKLYDHRDKAEAENFINHLISTLQIPKESTILDLACGKGRHSSYLHHKGMNVTGVDLSPESIAYAAQWEEMGLEFYTHDMRRDFRMNYYDYIFNLFTSFGYFQSEKEHLKVLEAVYNGLRENAVFVMDFLNERYVANRLVAEEQIIKNDLVFNIRRKIDKGYIIKNIDFEDDGKIYGFEERVRALSLGELEDLFSKCGLNLTAIHGDYNLGKFDLEHSPRLILIAKK